MGCQSWVRQGRKGKGKRWVTDRCESMDVAFEVRSEVCVEEGSPYDGSRAM